MSLEGYALTEAKLTQCQLQEMAYELFDEIGFTGDPEFGCRLDVVLTALTPPDVDDGADSDKLVPFIRGDTNGDGQTDLADAIRILFHLFVGLILQCPDTADTNGDKKVDCSDAIHVLNVFYRDQGTFPSPGVRTCSGSGSTSTGLGKCTYDANLCPPQGSLEPSEGSLEAP